MNITLSNLSTFFEDNSGGFSMMRLVFFAWATVVLLMWAYTCYMTGGLVSIPSEVITILLGLGTAKTIQRGLEKIPENTTTSTTTTSTTAIADITTATKN